MFWKLRESLIVEHMIDLSPLELGLFVDEAPCINID
jgi:hypothetical protein